MSWVYKEKEESILISQLYESLKEEEGFSKKRAIIIAGPTSVGKTKLSIEIAKKIGGEIISADSMQIYKEMNIGTAKASLKERKEVVHHLINICSILDDFSVVNFYERSKEALRDIVSREKVPIIVGGSGFYIHTLLYGPPKGPPRDKNLRKELEQKADNFGLDLLYERLKELDPKYAKTITNSDKHKIIRALEIIYISKKPVSFFPVSHKIEENLDFRMWFLYMPKEILVKKVEERCDEMIKNGFIEEVKRLKENGLEKNYSACCAIGYKQCLNFLKTQQTEEDFQNFLFDFKKASRKYIKRQFTWFRKEKYFRWLDLSKIKEEKAIEYIIQDFES